VGQCDMLFAPSWSPLCLPGLPWCSLVLTTSGSADVGMTRWPGGGLLHLGSLKGRLCTPQVWLQQSIWTAAATCMANGMRTADMH
jgi:hypothetical protein